MHQHAAIAWIEPGRRFFEPDSAQADFGAAADGAVLEPGGQVRTGDDGRARLDLSDGTRMRVGPSSTFLLQDMKQTASGPNTTIHLDQGRLWILLSTGSLEVETSSGVASVRGSYLSVEDQGGGAVRVTCLEGDCTLGNDAGTVKLIAGEAAVVTGADGSRRSKPSTSRARPCRHSEPHTR